MSNDDASGWTVARVRAEVRRARAAPQPTIREVSGCDDCPALSFPGGPAWCGLRGVSLDDGWHRAAPPDCPLRVSPVTLRLVEESSDGE